MRIILLFGLPGSGKGTLSKALQKKYNKGVIFSMGDSIKKEIRKGTELGKIAQRYTDNGHLVPDEIIQDIFKKALGFLKEKKIKYCIMEGFPRSNAQLDIFLKGIKNEDSVFSLIINCSLETSKNRCLNRRICVKCHTSYLRSKLDNKALCPKCWKPLEMRGDDGNIEIWKSRLGVWNSQTVSCIENIRKLHPSREVSSEESPEKLTLDVEDILNSLEWDN